MNEALSPKARRASEEMVAGDLRIMPAPFVESAKPRKSIQSVETGIRVIEALISTVSGRAPLRDIALAANMSRSQAHRYLLAYVNTGLVTQDAFSGLYSLGPVALRIGLSAVSRLDVVQQASAELRDLVDSLGFTGMLSIWGDYGPTVVRWIDGERRLVTSLTVGSVLPLQMSSAGTVFLAFLPPAKAEKLLEKERSLGDAPSRAELAERIRRTRKAGYATTDGRVVPGLAAISVPVFDLQGWPAATIGLIGRLPNPTFFSTANVAAVRDAARRASMAIGWRPDQGAAIEQVAKPARLGEPPRRALCQSGASSPREHGR